MDWTSITHFFSNWSSVACISFVALVEFKHIRIAMVLIQTANGNRLTTYLRPGYTRHACLSSITSVALTICIQPVRSLVICIEDMHPTSMTHLFALWSHRSDIANVTFLSRVSFWTFCVDTLSVLVPIAIDGGTHKLSYHAVVSVDTNVQGFGITLVLELSILIA